MLDFGMSHGAEDFSSAESGDGAVHCSSLPDGGDTSLASLHYDFGPTGEYRSIQNTCYLACGRGVARHRCVERHTGTRFALREWESSSAEGRIVSSIVNKPNDNNIWLWYIPIS